MEYLRERMHDNHEEAEDDCEGELLRKHREKPQNYESEEGVLGKT